MTSEWQVKPLGDIVSVVIDYRGKTPKKLGGDWSIQGTRALSAKNIKTREIVQPETIRFVDVDMYKSWMKEEIQRGDILITSEAPFGEVFYWDSDEKIVLSQRLFAVRCKKEFYSPFIFQYMTSEQFQGELRGRSTGTTVTGLRQPELLKCLVAFPDYKEQVAIADTLSALDARIAENRAINNHLEQLAQAIFAEQCKQGEKAVLSDILTVCYGKDHKRLGDGTTPCYGSGGIMRYVDAPLYSGESVLIPRKGSLNNVLYINEPFWTVDTMFYTHMTRPNVAKFVYFTVRDLDLAGMNVGSAVPSMTTAVLNALEIVLPNDETLVRFEEAVSPMFLQMQANNAESARLAVLRDALLPRLMSGDLSVADVDDK